MGKFKKGDKVVIGELPDSCLTKRHYGLNNAMMRMVGENFKISGISHDDIHGGEMLIINGWNFSPTDVTPVNFSMENK